MPKAARVAELIAVDTGPEITLEDLLAQSRAAHTAYRQALQTRSLEAAQAALGLAQSLRKTAQLSDPAMTSPAWASDALTHPHVDLLAFYDQQLGTGAA